MTATLINSVGLFFKDGSSDKEYNVTLEQKDSGYVVNFLYGRRGNATSAGTKTNSPVALAEATKIYDKLVAEKMSKGYKPDGAGTQVTTVVGDRKSTGNIPQLLNPISEDEAEFYINSPMWMAQEKLDGKHIMAHIKDKSVVTSNRNGLECGVPSEIAKELAACDNILLDGELIGSTYHTFDVVETCLDHRNTSAKKRFEILCEWIRDHKFSNVKIVSCAFTTEAKRALYESLKHKEGVVFKHIDSKYVSGRPNSGGNMLKCKFWSSATVLVSAVNDKRSVMVSVEGPGDRLVSVGNVTVPPNYSMPQVGDLIEVKYLYFVNSLYQPQYLGIRDDKNTADTLESLKPKSEND